MILNILISILLISFAYGQNCEDHQKCLSADLCNDDGTVNRDGNNLLKPR